MSLSLYWSAFIYGFLGGFLPLLLPLAKRKKALPVERLSKEEQMGRLGWFLAKLAVSMLVSLMVTLWFMDDAVAQRITHSKMIFIQLVSGSMPLPILAAFQNYVLARIKKAN